MSRPVVVLLLGAALAWCVWPVLPGVGWALVLACAVWPLVQGMRGEHRGWFAFGMTLGIAALLVVPLILLGIHASQAWQVLQGSYQDEVAQGWPLPLALANLHQGWIQTLWRKAAISLPSALSLHGQDWLRGVAGRTEGLALDALVALMALLAVLRDAPACAGALRMLGQETFGWRFVHAASAALRAIRAMFWVVVLVSIAEAVLLAMAFDLAGVPHPIGFGALAGLASIIPGVTLLVVLGAAGWLYLKLSVAWGIGIAVFGLGLSALVDHVVKPVFISRTAGLPVLLALLSMLIGALSFGLIGLFLGPGLAAFFLVLLAQARA